MGRVSSYRRNLENLWGGHPWPKTRQRSHKPLAWHHPSHPNHGHSARPDRDYESPNPAASGAPGRARKKGLREEERKLVRDLSNYFYSTEQYGTYSSSWPEVRKAVWLESNPLHNTKIFFRPELMHSLFLGPLRLLRSEVTPRSLLPRR